MISDERLTYLIADIERHAPNPDGTFAEVLEFLRELQRMRAALPSTADDVTIVPGMAVNGVEVTEVGKDREGRLYWQHRSRGKA